MKCPTCGNDNSADAQFCVGCGTAIGEPSGDGSTIGGRRKSSTSSGFGAHPLFDKEYLGYLFLSIKGRINRQRYFQGFLLLLAVAFVASIPLEFLMPVSGFVLGIIFLPATTMLGINRAHDLSHSGWILILCFVPLVQLFALGYLFLARGTPGPNRYDIRAITRS